jgi:hypothetical protein
MEMRWLVLVLGACAGLTHETRQVDGTAPPAGDVAPSTAPLMATPSRSTTTDHLHPFEITEMSAGVQIVRHGPFCLPSDNVLAVDTVSHEVARELATYPPRLLAAAHIQRATLCARIDDMGVGDALGLADVVEDRILIDIHAEVGVVVPHELFHLVDLNARYTAEDEFNAFDLAWHYTNPPGFAYGGPVSSALATELSAPHGFVDAYATTDALEDRASTFEYVMARPLATCELARSDVGVRRKVGLIWARVAQIVGDDGFLTDRAPCVAALLRGE